MKNDESVERYIETLAGRLDEFEQSTTTVDNQRVTVFHDRSLSLSKFGLVDTVFVVGTAETASQARAFSEATFEHGLSLKSRFPRGVGGNLVVYPVVVSETDLADWVQQYDPKHWSSFEFPVVIDPIRGYRRLLRVDAVVG
ncbi:hypothetical protein [Halorubrum sp. AS12]|uniref:hypothetical protein n=1 Tax=Halorubrum sp. AS12 TaxID=3409687 RepID=UPI003DA6F19B